MTSGEPRPTSLYARIEKTRCYLILVPILIFVVVSVVLRLIFRPIWNPYRIRRPYFGPYGYYGYGYGYRPQSIPGRISEHPGACRS